jgi:hypothetical protein
MLHVAARARADLVSGRRTCHDGSLVCRTTATRASRAPSGPAGSQRRLRLVADCCGVLRRVAACCGVLLVEPAINGTVPPFGSVTRPFTSIAAAAAAAITPRGPSKRPASGDARQRRRARATPAACQCGGLAGGTAARRSSTPARGVGPQAPQARGGRPGVCLRPGNLRQCRDDPCTA